MTTQFLKSFASETLKLAVSKTMTGVAITILALLFVGGEMWGQTAPTIIFTPSSGTTLTRADVDATLSANGLTRYSEFHAVIEGATEIAGGSHVTNAVFSQSRILSVSSFTLTSIGKIAFYECSSLTSVDFPLVTSIDFSAFSRCSSLVSVDFPLVTSIGNFAFS